MRVDENAGELAAQRLFELSTSRNNCMESKKNVIVGWPYSHQEYFIVPKVHSVKNVLDRGL